MHASSTEHTVCDVVLLFIREVAIHSSITIYLILTNEVIIIKSCSTICIQGSYNETSN